MALISIACAIVQCFNKQCSDWSYGEWLPSLTHSESWKSWKTVHDAAPRSHSGADGICTALDAHACHARHIKRLTWGYVYLVADEVRRIFLEQGEGSIKKLKLYQAGDLGSIPCTARIEWTSKTVVYYDVWTRTRACVLYHLLKQWHCTLISSSLKTNYLKLSSKVEKKTEKI